MNTSYLVCYVNLLDMIKPTLNPVADAQRRMVFDIIIRKARGGDPPTRQVDEN